VIPVIRIREEAIDFAIDFDGILGL